MCGALRIQGREGGLSIMYAKMYIIKLGPIGVRIDLRCAHDIEIINM